MELTNVRVMEIDTANCVKMGQPFWTDDLTGTAINVRKQYEERFEWCGGFANACERFYLKVAIVDAKTFQMLHSIYVSDKCED